MKPNSINAYQMLAKICLICGIYTMCTGQYGDCKGRNIWACLVIDAIQVSSTFIT